jgi:hypothetical protein
MDSCLRRNDPSEITFHYLTGQAAMNIEYSFDYAQDKLT